MCCHSQVVPVHVNFERVLRDIRKNLLLIVSAHDKNTVCDRLAPLDFIQCIALLTILEYFTVLSGNVCNNSMASIAVPLLLLKFASCVCRPGSLRFRMNMP